jgi:hypothetical protein
VGGGVVRWAAPRSWRREAPAAPPGCPGRRCDAHHQTPRSEALRQRSAIARVVHGDLAQLVRSERLRQDDVEGSPQLGHVDEHLA